MDISFQSLLCFLIVTVAYFAVPSIGKPTLMVNALKTDDARSAFFQSQTHSLWVYLGAVLTSQLFLNVGYLMAKCGGSLSQNMGAAALYTLVPWTLMFGAMVAVLLAFPGFKSAFSDVVGYFAVSGEAAHVFSSMLLSSDVQNAIAQTSDANEKHRLTQAAEAILKICGNQSVLINQMNVGNFLSMWDMLRPLMRPGVYEDEAMQNQLLHLVVLKDNIGEGMWYMYTAILISSIVYYNLATRGCVKSREQIKADHDAYLQQKEAAAAQASVNNSTTYITS